MLDGGIPLTRSRWWVGTWGTPNQVWMVGVPHPRSGWWGYPIPGLDGGATPSQVWMVRGTWGTPRPGLDGGGYPTPGLDGGGVPGEPPPTHETEQHSKHLLRGGRCVSCVHTGGISCIPLNSD